jgi:hypothetical protein
MVSAIGQAALSREAIPEADRKPFFLIVDEFQNATNDYFDTILSAARKYKLSLILAHQFFDQVPERIRKSALANCGNFITFRAVADDAPLIAKHLGWRNPDTRMELADYSVMAKFLRIDPHTGKRRPSNVLQIDQEPLPEPADDHSRQITRRSQNEMGRPRTVVEGRIRKFLSAEPKQKPRPKRACKSHHQKVLEATGMAEPEGEEELKNGSGQVSSPACHSIALSDSVQ